MTLSEELRWRGFINQTTLENLTELDTKEWTFYHGFDASSDSQTIGNLAAMMLDLVFLRHGHKAILLAGGATSLIGDPGGKDEERPLQSEETIRYNVAQAEKQLRHIMRGHDFTMVNNIDWYQSMNVIAFLRDIGKHFGMSTLVQRDYIQKRIGEGGGGMSFTEFSYTLLQGYDFLHLFNKYGCTLQLAGADQWGNSLSGIELIRKTHAQQAHVITLPLVINKATGKKFGKSEAGAIWLDEVKTSVYKFYQFWLNIDDEGVIDYLKIYTLLSKADIDALEVKTQAAPQKRAAQKTLAYEVTKLVHSEERVNNVMKVTEVLFGNQPVASLSKQELTDLAAEIPTTHSGESVVKTLLMAGLAGSMSEAGRLIKNGGISLNGQKVTNDEVINTTPSLLKKGKNSFCLIR
ncbi:MAG TPA: tyrosine--tRNA ligase [Candidatus Saccharimonadales bacterium]